MPKLKLRCKCGKFFYCFPYEIKRNRKYCDITCFNKYRYTHRIIDRRGYILIYEPNHPFAKSTGYVYEHRVIMETRLKRILKNEENIHHLDGNPQNNDIKNLALTDRSNHLKIYHPNAGKKSRFTTKGMLEYWKNKKSNKVNS